VATLEFSYETLLPHARLLPDAEDAVQETLLRAWRNRYSVKEGAPLRPWPYRVATERLPRKYVCGVVPSIVRNISMKALTLS
jgi:hypothetical protein